MKTLKFENPRAEGYRDLLVWQKGIAVAKLVHALTKTFPSDEEFGLISQMRRAAVSISSNIAGGQARHATGEFIQFISHAEGSVAGLDTQLHLPVELGFTTEPQAAAACFELLGELRRILNGLRRKLSASR